MDALPNLYSSDVIKMRKTRHTAHTDEKGSAYKLIAGRSKGRDNLQDP